MRYSRHARILVVAALLMAVSVALRPAAGHADEAAPLHTYKNLPFRSATSQDSSSLPPEVGSVSTNVDVSNARGPQSETIIVGSPVNPSGLVAGSNDIALPLMDAYRSLNGGANWTRSQLPLSSNCAGSGFPSDPALGVNLSGEFFYGFLSICNNGSSEVDVSHSTDGGHTWTPATAFRFTGGSSGGPDKELLTVDDNASSPTKGRIYVSWDENFLNGQQHIELIWSDDNGLTWHAPVQVDINSSAGVIYADPIAGRDGRVYVAWNDYGISQAGRFSLIRFAAASNTPAAGYVPAFTSNTTVAASGINLFLPSRFFIAAQPDRGIAADPTLLIDGNNKLYMVWNQGKRGSNVTDVEVKSSTDGGATWSTAVQVNDDNTPGNFTTGASDFFPAGALDTSGNLHVTFYSTRLDTTNRTTNFYESVSTDGGATFSPNVRLTDVASNESTTNPSRDPNDYGDYEGLTIQNGLEHPVWTDSRNSATKQEEVYTTTH